MKHLKQIVFKIQNIVKNDLKHKDQKKIWMDPDSSQERIIFTAASNKNNNEKKKLVDILGGHVYWVSPVIIHILSMVMAKYVVKINYPYAFSW